MTYNINNDSLYCDVYFDKGYVYDYIVKEKIKNY